MGFINRQRCDINNPTNVFNTAVFWCLRSLWEIYLRFFCLFIKITVKYQCMCVIVGERCSLKNNERLLACYWEFSMYSNILSGEMETVVSVVVTAQHCKSYRGVILSHCWGQKHCTKGMKWIMKRQCKTSIVCGIWSIVYKTSINSCRYCTCMKCKWHQIESCLWCKYGYFYSHTICKISHIIFVLCTSSEIPSTIT